VLQCPTSSCMALNKQSGLCLARLTLKRLPLKPWDRALKKSHPRIYGLKYVAVRITVTRPCLFLYCFDGG